ncbi:MAG TPA: hypothetical protein VFV78_11825 [Vicinamibacterales bacterium]|nr:hypothetical protein [Vicinamibacterales bacterium]
MPRRVLMVVVALVASLSGTAAALRAAQVPAQNVIVHEWGTFTTIAGEDGQAMNWVPLGGPTDLPCFVEHYKNRLFKVILAPDAEAPVPMEYETARSSLVGKVRMETPVLYFYSSKEAAVSVRVRFPQGLLTEWYPTATATQPNVLPKVLDDPSVVGGLDWPYVAITPDRTPSLPMGTGPSHYYAARQTDASPISVNGRDEKFLFYRGVAGFPVPIAAALEAGGSVRVTNLGREPIPSVILFDNHAGAIRYRSIGALQASAIIGRPAGASDPATLRADLVKTLVRAGLYDKEAQAMVDTWRDSWFEEGTRVFYVLPRAAVDAILPLTITPAPTQIARAFVGRMELVTPETLVEVQAAIARNDTALLESRGRFLGPIADQLIAKTSSVTDRTRIRGITNSVFANYQARFATCR